MGAVCVFLFIFTISYDNLNCKFNVVENAKTMDMKKKLFKNAQCINNDDDNSF